jgi:transcriptional regulator with XRE-family HTH domain
VERVPQKQLDILRRNLRRLRIAAGLTQEALAEKAGISPRYLQIIEAGDFGCSLAVLIRLRRALNVSWDTLLKNIR